MMMYLTRELKNSKLEILDFLMLTEEWRRWDKTQVFQKDYYLCFIKLLKP